MAGKHDDRFLITVPFLPFTCPRCQAFKPRTYRVERRRPVTRYHQCSVCSFKYRSTEITREEIRDWLVKDVPDVVPFLAFNCPTCKAFKPRTYSVNRSDQNATMRYHTCKNCGDRYRSVQVDRSTMQRWMPDSDRLDLGRGRG
tara:strand:+ start:2825 stop:3253 length:429 start_codon:yes stop_codon:yes gene_type:complete